MKKECLFIDVFTDTPYAGNQLAVFPDAEDISGERMQQLAKEINYSEITFILNSQDADADYDIRIFTPNFEIPFAGHPALGTAYTIMTLLDGWPTDKKTIRLKTKVGTIPLVRQNGLLWMKQNAPEFHRQHTDLNTIADLVGLTANDIASELPVEEVSTGNNMLIVPVNSLSAIQKANGNVNRLLSFFDDQAALAPYLFALETVDAKASVHTRFFGAHIGILEDPATGSAAGPLTAYLLKHDVFGSSFEIQNEQGLEMGRPSSILMKGVIDRGRYDVRIGGQCAYVGRGEFTLS
jgi:trans-2,3-dihydro-3-hydroxyanthranilate isomerase